MQQEEAREEGFLMRFNIWRCLGILASWAAVFLFFLMLHYDPGDFLQRLARDNSNLILIFIVAVSFAAVFLSIEKRKE